MTILLVDGIMAIRLFVVVLRPKSTVMILHYFMTYNQESMGPGRDRNRHHWICSQTRTCCQTRYRLRNTARVYGHSCQNVSCCSLFSQQCLKFTKASLPFFNDTSKSFYLIMYRGTTRKCWLKIKKTQHCSFAADYYLLNAQS